MPICYFISSNLSNDNTGLSKGTLARCFYIVIHGRLHVQHKTESIIVEPIKKNETILIEHTAELRQLILEKN